MNVTYLVDLENIGTKSLYQHVKDNLEEEYLIFYSNSTSTPNSMLKHLPDMLNVSFIDCKSGGNNAMDFCISMMAGKLSTNRYRKLRILSSDKGYDPMVCMLQEQGVRIERESVTYQSETENVHLPVEEPNEYTLRNAIRKYVPKKYQNDMAKAIVNVISRKEAHEICQAILPKSMATDVYKKLRKYIPKEVI